MTAFPQIDPRSGKERPIDLDERKLRAWHFALLRFAVTLDDADCLNVLAIAKEIDQHGRQELDTEFRFFRRTSAELCLAISGSGETRPQILRCYLAQIEESRFKQAFAAAVGILEQPLAPARRRPKHDQDLFRGLPLGKSAGLGLRKA